MRALASIAIVVCAPLSFGGTIYVDSGLSSGADDGTSWANAYRTTLGLQTALAASVSGDQIWVNAGAYKPTITTTRTISFHLKNGVELYGGFLGGETSIAQRPPFWTAQSFLLGDLNLDDGSGLYGDNSFHVLDAGGTNASAVLDGFTIEGGNANVGGSNQDRGGGILCVSGASPTVRNCRFLFNRCTFGGGAGYVNASSPTFTHCTFESNVGGSFGGAFDCDANALAKWDRCFFSLNTAARAGAVELFSSAAGVTSCLFVDNVSTGSGGGGAMFVAGSSPAIRDSTFVGNSATANATGGILSSGSTMTIANCIFWANSGTGGAMGSVNQISPTTLASVSYTCVMGGHAGAGNLAADPQFANLAARDLSLTLASPCIDAGNNASVPAGSTLDFAGNARFVDEPTIADTGLGSAPIVDIGAYEFPATLVASYCFGDGTGTACPCGNNAPSFSGTGCLHSLGTGGLLSSSGSAAVSADTFVLQGSGMTNASCLYFQGTTQLNSGLGTPFGDGLRCAGGAIVRLRTKSNSGGVSQYPGAGDASVSVRGGVTSAGSVRTYQVWYRNAAAFCQPETFNLTSALRVLWVP